MWMEIEKSKVLIKFLLNFGQSGDVLFFLNVRRLRGYTATEAWFLQLGLYSYTHWYILCNLWQKLGWSCLFWGLIDVDFVTKELIRVKVFRKITKKWEEKNSMKNTPIKNHTCCALSPPRNKKKHLLLNANWDGNWKRMVFAMKINTENNQINVSFSS